MPALQDMSVDHPVSARLRRSYGRLHVTFSKNMKHRFDAYAQIKTIIERRYKEATGNVVSRATPCGRR
jgi:hypothetical protein